MLRVMAKPCKQDVDAAGPRDTPAIAQGRDERKCLGCGKLLGEYAQGHRERCNPCGVVHRREYNTRWRSNRYQNDTEYRTRQLRYHEKRRRAAGILPLEMSDAERRKRRERLLPKIYTLQANGFSCAAIGERLGLSKNAVIGLIDRARRNALRGHSGAVLRTDAIAEAPVERGVNKSIF